MWFNFQGCASSICVFTLPEHFVHCEMWLTNSADELKYLWAVILSVWRMCPEIHRVVANTCQTDSSGKLPLELKSPIHHVKSINLTICFVLAGLQRFSLKMILTYVTVTKAHKKAPEQSVLNKSVLCFYAAHTHKKQKLGEYAKITWFHLVFLW